MHRDDHSSSNKLSFFISVQTTYCLIPGLIRMFFSECMRIIENT